MATTGTKSFKGEKTVHRKESNSAGPTGSLSLSERIGQKPLRYALVVVIGITGALLTIGFYFMYLLLWNETFFVITHFAWSSFVCAALALSLSFMLVKQFAQMKTMGSGTHTVLETYHLKDGDITLTDTLVKPLAAVFTMGFGGSAGPEGPSMLVGGGVASNISKLFRVKVSDMRRIFIAGAAAGLTAVFRTPLTGILFALEIPYKRDLEMQTFVEASLATVPAYLIAILILGTERLFGTVTPGQITMSDVGMALVMGILCGAYSVFYTELFSAFDRLAGYLRSRIGTLSMLSLGTLVLGAAGYVSVYSFGTGLNLIAELVNGTSLTVSFLFFIILLKTVTTSVTLNFGGSGGLFFPTIVIGASVGALFSLATGDNNRILFIAIGMAALLAGTHKILLTPTAFVVETLGGACAIPALLASGVSYLVSGDCSFYPLQPRGRHQTEELALERLFYKAKVLIPEKLEATMASDFMTLNPIAVSSRTAIKNALELFEKTRLRVLPVVDEGKRVLGTVTMEDLANLDFKQLNMTLSEALIRKPLMINVETSLREVAELMMEKEEDHMFVVDENMKLLGVISGIDVARKILELTT